MTLCCIVVADEARARLFRLETAETPELESGPRLVEHKDLVNPEARASAEKFFSNSGTTSWRAALGTPGHGYDDHRIEHRHGAARRFADEILKEAVSVASARQTRRVILVAPARMAGFLRKVQGGEVKSGIELETVVNDMTKLRPQDIHNLLAKKGVVPERKAPGR